jgi:molecular chaperone GrpE
MAKKQEKTANEVPIPPTIKIDLDFELENKKLIEEIEKKNLMLNETIGHLQRLQAEFQNYQKDIQTKMELHKDYAAFEIVLRLLNVKDEFEAALKNIKTEEKEVFDGVKMIFNNFRKVLEEHGVKEIKSVGEKFDPFKHETVQLVKMEGKDGDVVEEIQKGYMFKEKLLRPSKVKVAGGK